MILDDVVKDFQQKEHQVVICRIREEEPRSGECLQDSSIILKILLFMSFILLPRWHKENLSHIEGCNRPSFYCNLLWHDQINYWNIDVHLPPGDEAVYLQPPWREILNKGKLEKTQRNINKMMK